MANIVPDSDFEAQRDRILRSERFIRAGRSAQLLTYLVGRALKDSMPEEWEIAADVFGRKVDPWTDETRNIVAVNLNRLKAALAEYYANEGSQDQVIINIRVRLAVPDYRETTPPVAPFNFEMRILQAGRAFFTAPEKSEIRCVVTGGTSDIEWHHLDRDPFNLSLGNLIPLSRRLRSNLDRLDRLRRGTLLRELDPKRLGDWLAPEHFRKLRPSTAYGCAALAFYLGAAPYALQPDHVRAMWLCDVMSYARRHFSTTLMRHVLRQMALPFLTRLDDAHPTTALRVAIQLTGLLEEMGSPSDAEVSLAFGHHIGRVVGKSFWGDSSFEAFGLLRRRAQLWAARAPDDMRFEGLFAQAQEHATEIEERTLSLQIDAVRRWLRQGSADGLKLAYAATGGIVSMYQPLITRNGAIKPPEKIAAHLGELILMSAIAACRLRPARWKSEAEEAIATARILVNRAGHVLPAEYRTLMTDTVRKHNANAGIVVRLSPSQLRPPPSEALRDDALLVLKCLTRLRLQRGISSQPHDGGHPDP